ncbi:MAG: carbohydrate kinase [Chitinophagaceae bacterium]|nr:carbohydrate kinase [Chitinophagaceae bacterium]
MLLMGIDLGTSSVKVSVLDTRQAKVLASVQYPETERTVQSLQPGWAEQDPETWWQDVQAAILAAHGTRTYRASDIAAIGITYQMHGLVMTDMNGAVIRPAIIWCDSRAVAIGAKAAEAMGAGFCLSHYLNLPGNFTASKLRWVQQHEPQHYSRLHQWMLPGDFIAQRLTGECTTTSSALSEGICWDFKTHTVADALLQHYQLDKAHIPCLQPLFGIHGRVTAGIAARLQLTKGIPVTYKAGDQPNNALALNVVQPGEVAANAGTSGVLYAVNDRADYDPLSRVNAFAHVTHETSKPAIGTLLCINGAGIMYRRTKELLGGALSYQAMNEASATIEPGANGLQVLPFGNGAERMLNNRHTGAAWLGVDLNRHLPAHFFRAAQEGIAFAFRYGMDIMRSNGFEPKVIRAGYANLFRSNVFTDILSQVLNSPIELYETDGSVGAARGAGIGAGIYQTMSEAFDGLPSIGSQQPRAAAVEQYEALYADWKHQLITALQSAETANTDHP